MPFEQARTQLCLGERRIRARRRADARDPLRAALTTFERLGAATWAETAPGVRPKASWNAVRPCWP